MQILSLVISLLMALFVTPKSTLTADLGTDSISTVQPLTGIVYWHTNPDVYTDAIALEYSYLKFDQFVKGENEYNWDALHQLLEEIAERNHQAIFRFRYTYVGKETSVPQYIKELPNYEETVKQIEKKRTPFPDWRHPKLRQFTTDFFSAFAKEFDQDNRIAYLQVGFGLWGEYHIHNDDTERDEIELGVNFPDIAYQQSFFQHLDTTFKELHWSISIDAADEKGFSPLRDHPELLGKDFGLFDDSFMTKDHKKYNEKRWNFFGKERYRRNPAGGEFTQKKSENRRVLSRNGIKKRSFKSFSEDFHITYMIGDHQKVNRVRSASLHCGYKFEVLDIERGGGKTTVRIKNYGVAPIYYDAYLSINSDTSSKTLVNLGAKEEDVFDIPTEEVGEIKIVCDRILETQSISLKNDWE